MKRTFILLLHTLLFLFLAGCGTQSKTPDTDLGMGNVPADSPVDAPDRYIIFLDQEVFPSFSHPSQQREYSDREEQGRAAEAYEAQMSEKIRAYAMETLGLSSDQIVNIMAAGFSAIVANLTPAQAAEVEQWPQRFPEVEEVNRDFEFSIDPGEVIIVDPDTLKQ